jgi:hypothetical protein
MSLLRDIQNAAVDPNTDVTTLLRKCKILAVRLGNEELKRWVDNELNGYEKSENLPKYRILHVGSCGHFSGVFGRRLENAPIPPSCLPEKFRNKITKSYMMQPISAYASLIDNEKVNPVEQWPADMVAMFGQKIYQDMTCISAWKVIPHNALVAVVDTIKTRILNFVLEIEEEAPDAGEANPRQPPLPQEKVSQVFNTYITGNVQNIATGSSNFTQASELCVIEGDFLTLAKYLESHGVQNEDIEELKDLLDTDKKVEEESPFDKRVQGWIGKMMGKAASGAWQVSMSTAGTLLGKALSKYYGIE